MDGVYASKSQEDTLRWSDVREFFLALAKHYKGLAAGSLVALLGFVFNVANLNQIWWFWAAVAVAGFFSSAFFSWLEIDKARRTCQCQMESLQQQLDLLLKSDAVVVNRLTFSNHPKAAAFFSAADSPDFAKHFIADRSARSINSTMFREWMDAPKDGVFREAHCRVEDLFFACTQKNPVTHIDECRAFLTGGWYPDAGFGWIGYLFTAGGDHSRGQFAPLVVGELVTELKHRRAQLCFFDVEETEARQLLRLYARYVNKLGGARLYSVEVDYKRPPDCAGAPPGKLAKLGVIDLSGLLDGAISINGKTCREWLGFVFKDAYGDAEFPETENWEEHHKAIQKELDTLLDGMSDDAVITLQEILPKKKLQNSRC
ncbi:hypothetical protein [Roseimicrobium sp. ORNL1]|uniref:hypothetical protein n=1 Tax=Roseimicrobium sp. ORNL1 TaxID=2711231 RepID=UPI0013E142AF|nr:hypothetical protein [Roseimicrobium sp. ORNL1]QIE99992.1 hypothetical protein G5S37_00110 [Roseimicrobium sp. ORNL1]